MAKLAEKRQTEVDKLVKYFKSHKSDLDFNDLVIRTTEDQTLNPMTNKKFKKYTETWVAFVKALDKVHNSSLYQKAISEKHLTDSGNPKRKPASSDSEKSSKASKSPPASNVGQFKYGTKVIKMTGDMDAIYKLIVELKDQGKIEIIGKKSPPKKKAADGWKFKRGKKFSLPAAEYYFGDVSGILAAHNIDTTEGHYTKDDKHVVVFAFDKDTQFKMDGDKDDDTIFDNQNGLLGVASFDLAQGVVKRALKYTYEIDSELTVCKTKDSMSCLYGASQFDLIQIPIESDELAEEEQPEIVDVKKSKKIEDDNENDNADEADEDEADEIEADDADEDEVEEEVKVVKKYGKKAYAKKPEQPVVMEVEEDDLDI